MPEVQFTKHPSGLMPHGPEANAWLAKQPAGSVVSVKVSTNRNGPFHSKFFALLNVSYENWENPEIDLGKYGKATTSFGTFRAFCIVKAGFWEMDVTPEGTMRPRPKSIKFGSMQQEEFEKLYSAVLNVIITHILPSWKVEDMDHAVDAIILGFG